jgi:hypothetical protein
MKDMFTYYAIVYLAGAVIFAFRVPFIYRNFCKYLREKCPQKLKEFYLDPNSWSGFRSIFYPWLQVLTLYKEHGDLEPELYKLMVKSRNSYTFTLLWVFIGFFGLCSIPFIFAVFRMLKQIGVI